MAQERRWAGSMVRASLLAAAALNGGTAAAQEPGVYLGAGIGLAKMSGEGAAGLLAKVEKQFAGDDRIGETTFTFDEGSGSGKILIGYQFGRHVAAEAYVAPLGSFSVETATGRAQTASGVTFSPSTGSGKYQVVAFGADVIGSIPLRGDLLGTGKVGYFAWSADLKATVQGTQFSSSVNGQDLKWGLGIAWQFSRHTQFRTEFENYDIPDSAIRVISIAFIRRAE